MKSIKKTFQFGEHEVTMETGAIARQADGAVMVTVADTAELRWWLLGFGDGVEVVRPKALRNEFREMTNNMARMYS